MLKKSLEKYKHFLHVYTPISKQIFLHQLNMCLTSNNRIFKVNYNIIIFIFHYITYNCIFDIIMCLDQLPTILKIVWWRLWNTFSVFQFYEFKTCPKFYSNAFKDTFNFFYNVFTIYTRKLLFIIKIILRTL